MAIGATELLTLLGLVAGSFVATNLDNLLFLVMLLGANPERRSAVLLGFLVSCIAVLTACAIGLGLSTLFKPEALGYLGLAPLLLGCHMLYQLHRGRSPGREDVTIETDTRETRIWLSSFVLLFSNSGDSIAVFLPLFAESGRAAILVLVSAYLIIATAWGTLSYVIAGRRQLAMQIEHRAEKLVPWIMIGVGIYILSDTATDTLVR